MLKISFLFTWLLSLAFLPGNLLITNNLNDKSMNTSSDNGALSTHNSTTCPSFDAAYYYVRRQCPAVIAQDLRCVYNLPGDAQPSGVLNCGTVDDYSQPSLHILSPEELLEQIRVRDSYGRPWCMLSFLYSPECVFSAKVANAFYQIAPLFPKLKVVAVDVSANTKSSDSLISQYGIASTPVIALWENGFPRFRLYEDYSNVESLINAVQKRTDLKSLNKSNYSVAGDRHKKESRSDDVNDITMTSDNTTRINFIDRHLLSKKEFLDQFHYLKDDLGFDWYLLVAIIVLYFNAAYFLGHSTKARELIQRWIF